MKTLIFDGTKSYDAPMNSPEAWTSLGQQKDATESELASRVAAVFRVRDLISNAVANVPFTIYRGEEEIDTSADWQNTLGFMPNPIDLIRRWRLSLMMSNSAYGFATKVPLTSKGANLQFLVSSTITPQTDSYTGELTGFKRETGTMTTTYPLKSGRIIYLWKLDETTEMLPSEYTEFRAMCSAAGIMHYTDLWTGNYFKRGGVKPTLIGVKGVATPTAREELEKGFSAWIKRLTQPAKVINAEAMEVNTIGDGIAELKDMSVYRQAVISVCTAVGISPSIILSDFANYATAQVAYWQLYKDKVNPDCQFFQEVLNTQIYEPLGLRMEFNTEAAEPNQEEEVQRAGAFKTYVDAKMPMEIAAQIVGVEMPEGYTYDDLKAAEEEKAAKEEADKQQQVELQKQRFGQKHYGPGEHPGTGTDQDVHGEGGGYDGKDNLNTSRPDRLPELQKGDHVNINGYSGIVDRVRTQNRTRYRSDDLNPSGPGWEEKYRVTTVTIINAAGQSASFTFGGIDSKSFTPTLDQIRELNRWQIFAFRKLRDGKALDFPFRLDVTPEAVGDAIRARLVEAKSEEAIKAAFDLAPETVTDAPDYSPLIKSIELGVEALSKVQAPIVVNNHMPPINIPATQVTLTQPEMKYDVPTITVNVPEQKAPNVTVNVPEQKAPVVNVTNDVQPAPVTLMKDKPPRVKVKKQPDGSYIMGEDK